MNKELMVTAIATTARTAGLCSPVNQRNKHGIKAIPIAFCTSSGKTEQITSQAVPSATPIG